MANANDQAEQHIGQTKGLPNHAHDLVHDLSTRLDALWRYDQCIANAEKAGPKDSKQFWQEMKAQEAQNIDRLKDLIRQCVKDGSF
ncbi:hypothetical protein [Hymenobacter rubripertinctus]|uniref:Ferritin n=1 Tax=Hymenobacter rubripertinctus TaxID=2029981 RepID=A0A418RAG6_9BACT|nr:hypothetical protein [Hymenobacter rubripertinctus]RIY14301.1 hypothetical protein D0T11_01040 [Hymenobacter rubripertinctus]